MVKNGYGAQERNHTSKKKASKKGSKLALVFGEIVTRLLTKGTVGDEITW